MFKSIKNTGELTEEFHATDEYLEKLSDDIGASARVYENENITVVGVQNSLGRFMAAKNDSDMIPYTLNNSETSIIVLLKPNTMYHYISVPGELSGIIVSDSQGYTEISFENTSHEIFVLSEDEQNLLNISLDVELWKEAIDKKAT